ncbi:MAG TPA: cytochrome c/FTR1 family iron permease [Gemmatimonadales bacterium]|nr:cytochrome c/FTR1 family iron permease [Gemmatimonadales bacterium]
MVACLTTTLGGQATDSLSAARRVVAAAALAAKEYRGGVAPHGGSVTAAAEVDEAKQFIDQAKLDVPNLPRAVRAAADSGLTALAAALGRTADPDSIDRWADALGMRIAAAVGGKLERMPTRPPSLERGRAVFTEQCTACHGAAGHGDGPKAAHLEGPHPADLADPRAMSGLAPLDIYRKVTIGVAGTAMPQFEETLSEEDRWAVTAYVATLQYGGSATAATFAAVRRQLDSAVAQRADKTVFDAYLTFEQVETDLRARDAGLTSRLEDEFATLRAKIGGGAGAAELDTLHRALLGDLERAERVVSDRASAPNLLVTSFLLLLREGFEAILIVGALMAFLGKAGASERRHEVVWGAWLAVLASGVTAVVVELLFHVSAGQREALEGVTMLIAVLVLFYVSYWLLSKVEADKWNAFLKSRMTGALSSGSGLALGSVAFLAVYREGFETILFYKALLSSAGTGEAGAVLVGIALGAVALVLLYLAINRWGMRIPLRPFFAVTGVLLYYMAFVFAGDGIKDLQEAGMIGLRVMEGWPRVPALGIYPTAQSLAAQGVLVVLALIALAWLRVRRAPSAAG